MGGGPRDGRGVPGPGSAAGAGGVRGAGPGGAVGVPEGGPPGPAAVPGPARRGGDREAGSRSH